MKTGTNIVLPHYWTARLHQQRFMRYMLTTDANQRAVLVWHRRAGKDNGVLNFTAVATQQKVANYWHMFPTQKQGRKVLWEGVNPHTGIRYIDQAFPKEMRESQNETEMLIRFKNGSTWQVVGSDTFDSNVGSNPFGIVLSEWALCDPRAWDFLRPILRENGGWAVFVYTPRGKNHGHRLYEMAKDNPNWYCELLTIEDTKREDGRRIFTDEDYQAELDEGMDPLLARQEYYCSFDAGLMGAYYTDALKRAKIGDYPWNPHKPVHTFWDIGMRDASVCWFGQESDQGDAINIIDYESANNRSFLEWLPILQGKPYAYGLHTWPHDAKQRKWSDGKSAVDVANEMHFDVEIAPSITLRDGIDHTKSFLPRCRFNNSPEVMQGYDCLTNYRREYNDKLQTFMDRPLHDWASHGADGFRIMAVSWPDNYGFTSQQQFGVKRSDGSYNRPKGRMQA